jgi:DNA repair photolyase
MRIFGGLKRDDWEHWGAFTTFKSNAASLLRQSMRPDQIIYCSPLVDPYQPPEADEQLMPGILDAVIEQPPRVFAIQTRGPLILRDLARLQDLSRRTCLRVSFSITTNREEIRRIYEPRCASIAERVATVHRLREAGIETYATLAPLLPCDPESLIDLALAASDRAIIADPFHVRSVKTSGATTHEPARRISQRRGFDEWHAPDFQAGILETMRRRASAAGRPFGFGTAAFAWLAEVTG